MAALESHTQPMKLRVSILTDQQLRENGYFSNLHTDIPAATPQVMLKRGIFANPQWSLDDLMEYLMKSCREDFNFTATCICILDSGLFTWPAKSLVQDIFEDNSHCFLIVRDPVTQTFQKRLGGNFIKNIIELHGSKGRGNRTLVPDSSRINEEDVSNISDHPQSYSNDPENTSLRTLTHHYPDHHDYSLDIDMVNRDIAGSEVEADASFLELETDGNNLNKACDSPQNTAEFEVGIKNHNLSIHKIRKRRCSAFHPTNNIRGNSRNKETLKKPLKKPSLGDIFSSMVLESSLILPVNGNPSLSRKNKPAAGKSHTKNQTRKRDPKGNSNEKKTEIIKNNNNLSEDPLHGPAKRENSLLKSVSKLVPPKATSVPQPVQPMQKNIDKPALITGKGYTENTSNDSTSSPESRRMDEIKAVKGYWELVRKTNVVRRQQKAAGHNYDLYTEEEHSLTTLDDEGIAANLSQALAKCNSKPGAVRSNERSTKKARSQDLDPSVASLGESNDKSSNGGVVDTTFSSSQLTPLSREDPPTNEYNDPKIKNVLGATLSPTKSTPGTSTTESTVSPPEPQTKKKMSGSTPPQRPISDSTLNSNEIKETKTARVIMPVQVPKAKSPTKLVANASSTSTQGKNTPHKEHVAFNGIPPLEPHDFAMKSAKNDPKQMKILQFLNEPNKHQKPVDNATGSDNPQNNLHSKSGSLPTRELLNPEPAAKPAAVPENSVLSMLHHRSSSIYASDGSNSNSQTPSQTYPYLDSPPLTETEPMNMNLSNPFTPIEPPFRETGKPQYTFLHPAKDLTRRGSTIPNSSRNLSRITRSPDMVGCTSLYTNISAQSFPNSYLRVNNPLPTRRNVHVEVNHDRVSSSGEDGY